MNLYTIYEYMKKKDIYASPAGDANLHLATYTGVDVWKTVIIYEVHLPTISIICGVKIEQSFVDDKAIPVCYIRVLFASWSLPLFLPVQFIKYINFLVFLSIVMS